MKCDPRVTFFDGHAPKWDSYGPPAEEAWARLDGLLSALGLEAGDEVLEVGCGTGQFTGWLEKVVGSGRVTAVDFSPAMIEEAKRRGVGASHVLADVCQEPLGTARYDVAFCLHVFPHFRDKAAALANMARALKSGGELVVLHLMGRQVINQVHHHAGGPVAEDRLPGAEQWGPLLTAAGLRLGEVKDQEDLFLLRATR